LVPMYAESNGRSMLEISSYMALAITGGLLLQVPVGKLSDAFDRRLIAGLMAVAFAAFSLMITSARPTPWFPIAWLLLGGFMSVIYPVCVAHANDRMPAERAVSVSSRLILISAFGSASGPILGAPAISIFGVGGLFSYMAAVAVLFAFFALLRNVGVRRSNTKRPRPFLLLPAIFAHNLAHASEEQR